MVDTSRPQREPKGPFQDMCHALRRERGLKLREVAKAIGVAVSTYGAVEASRHRVISDERVAKLANFYELSPGDRRKLFDAAAALPLSEYGERARARWAKRNEFRSKARRFTMMFESLDDLVCMLAAEGRPCGCAPAAPADFEGPARDAVVCPLCKAMNALGIPDGYTSPESAFQRIAAMHVRLEAAKSGSK